MTELNGILAVDKPEGPTSHDVVARARRALRLRRIGHTGTLDPFASGLLLLCLGPATRLAEYLTAQPKSYHAILRLGQATDTDDLTGEVISSSDAWRELTETEVVAAIREQSGVLDQLPPIYSAKKVDGERMYAAARRGETPERTTSRVEVHGIELLRFDPPDVEFTVDCSSGTYIRSIARDVGESLGVGAHLTRLRRTRIGSFDVRDAVTLGELDAGEVARALTPASSAVGHLASVEVDAEGLRALRHGGAVPAPESAPSDAPVALLDPAGELLAIGERKGDRIQPRKVFV